MARFLLILNLLLAHGILAFSQQKVVAGTPTASDRFPKKIGNIRFTESVLKLGRVSSNELRSDTLRVLNVGTKDVRWERPRELPTHLQISLSAETLPAGAEGWIAVSYDAREKKDFGAVYDRLVITSDDTESPKKVITIAAILYEYFPPMTSEDSLLVQRSRIPETVFDFGTIGPDTKVEHDFPVYNDGKRDLILHKTHAACGCIKTAMQRQVIPPGDSTFIHLTYDPFGKDGKESRSFLLFQNDPVSPEVRFDVRGFVGK